VEEDFPDLIVSYTSDSIRTTTSSCGDESNAPSQFGNSRASAQCVA
jgi:hypothetical protein